jgi:GT2 family glycosyltransferase
MHIEAVSVNHNTSPYTELMLRSLFAQHKADLSLAVTIFDNGSTDGTIELVRYAASVGVPVLPSGWNDPATRSRKLGMRDRLLAKMRGF